MLVGSLLVGKIELTTYLNPSNQLITPGSGELNPQTCMKCTI